jgi:hypothetical protein
MNIFLFNSVAVAQMRAFSRRAAMGEGEERT